MKWRNQLLALFCLLVFAAFGVLYFRYWVVQKPFGIILFVAEGFSADRLAPLRLYAADAATPLTIDTLAYTALLKNYSADSATPDSAAAATALATGAKVKNGMLGVDAAGNALPNLIELARAAGRVTGLVTDGRLTSPTAAAFYAHTTAIDNRPELARTLVERGNIDIVLGGGSSDFIPQSDGGGRPDGRDLLQDADEAGYNVVRTRGELEAVPWWRWPTVFGVFGAGDLTHGDEIGPDTVQPSLSNMVRRGIELLQIHRGGYLLVVDASLMRRAAEQNDTEATLAAMLELDRAISVALRFAGNKATVFVCGDVAVGGMKMVGAPPRSVGSSDSLSDVSLGETHFTWATGPRGVPPAQPPTRAPTPEPPPAARSPLPEDPPPIQADAAMLSPEASALESPSTSEVSEPVSVLSTLASPPAAAEVSPAATAGSATTPQAHAAIAIYAPSALPTVEDVIAFGHGRGAEALHGTIENTVLFEIIRDNL